RVHRVDERLVAVAQVDGAPEGGLLDLAVGPLAIGEAKRKRPEGNVLVEGHLLRGQGFRRHLSLRRSLGDGISFQRKTSRHGCTGRLSASASGALAVR